jgi:hypothetical protein
VNDSDGSLLLQQKQTDFKINTKREKKKKKKKKKRGLR